MSTATGSNQTYQALWCRASWGYMTVECRYVGQLCYRFATSLRLQCVTFVMVPALRQCCSATVPHSCSFTPLTLHHKQHSYRIQKNWCGWWKGGGGVELDLSYLVQQLLHTFCYAFVPMDKSEASSYTKDYQTCNPLTSRLWQCLTGALLGLGLRCDDDVWTYPCELNTCGADCVSHMAIRKLKISMYGL